MLATAMPTELPGAHVAPGLRISRAGLAGFAVFVAVAMSGVVFSEPAPVDLAMMGLVVLLPVLGQQRYAPGMVAQFLLWFACGAAALVASSMSMDVDDSTRHTLISFYLYAKFLVLAAYVAHRPVDNSRLILGAWVLAAMVAALAGLIGYFRLAPGAYELFTRFDRAAGTFKDPNVLGPFLVPAALYLVHRLYRQETRFALLDLAGLALLVGAILLTFSRGAWFNLVAAFAIYGTLTFATLASAAARARLLGLVGLAIALAGLTLFAALQVDEVALLLAERAQLTQSYDVGPDGRFGGQSKAIGLLLTHPLGLGAKQFATNFHSEDVHNVVLSMFLNSGWLGGLLYIAAVVSTLVLGLAHVARGTPTRPLFLIAYAAFAATVVEGFVIDTDHWRHFYVLLALVWGLMSGAQATASRRRQPLPAVSRLRAR